MVNLQCHCKWGQKLHFKKNANHDTTGKRTWGVCSFIGQISAGMWTVWSSHWLAPCACHRCGAERPSDASYSGRLQPHGGLRAATRRAHHQPLLLGLSHGREEKPSFTGTQQHRPLHRPLAHQPRLHDLQRRLQGPLLVPPHHHWLSHRFRHRLQNCGIFHFQLVWIQIGESCSSVIKNWKSIHWKILRINCECSVLSSLCGQYVELLFHWTESLTYKTPFIIWKLSCRNLLQNTFVFSTFIFCRCPFVVIEIFIKLFNKRMVLN